MKKILSILIIFALLLAFVPLAAVLAEEGGEKPTVDYSALQTLYDDVKDFKPIHVSKDGKDVPNGGYYVKTMVDIIALEDALAATLIMLTEQSAESQAEVDSTYAILQNAVATIHTAIVDLTWLQLNLAHAEAFRNSKVFEKSSDGLQARIENAIAYGKLVMENPDIMQSEVEEVGWQINSMHCKCGIYGGHPDYDIASELLAQYNAMSALTIVVSKDGKDVPDGDYWVPTAEAKKALEDLCADAIVILTDNFLNHEAVNALTLALDEALAVIKQAEDNAPYQTGEPLTALIFAGTLTLALIGLTVAVARRRRYNPTSLRL
ncbi:MAG: hypothetical protein FWE69_03015 [Clostridiales bacterium]|nr:hypothetical protein [Clostridiales bacterium]